MARLVFDLLEQLRVESLTAPTLPGVRANLAHRHRTWARACVRSGLTDHPQGLLLYTVAQLCRARLTGEPVSPETEGLIEETRAALARTIGADLVGLRRDRHDQRTFAVHALAIAMAVADAFCDLAPSSTRTGPADDLDAVTVSPLALLVFDEAGEGLGSGAVGSSGPDAPRDGSHGSYRVFTSAYDEERPVSTLVRADVLSAHRARLDRAVAAQGVSAGRVARLVRSLFGVNAPAGWEGGQERGVVDGSVLTRLVTSPGDRRLFREERDGRTAPLRVTLLVDCSGSMKAHAISVAVIVDVLARGIEQAGGQCEVLGFTTASWSGGRAGRDWVRAGRPAGPGRLNERRHLVIKDTETPWRRARTSLAALLHEELYREGIDGEALAWAADRAARSCAARRLVLMVSDGGPSDTATTLANDPAFLDRHLRAVVSRLEAARNVEVYGVGVGVDLRDPFRRSTILDLDRGPRHATFAEILALATPQSGSSV